VSLQSTLNAGWELDETSGTEYDSAGPFDLTDHSVGSGTGIIYANARDFEESSGQYAEHADDADLRVVDGVPIAFDVWFKIESLPGGGDYRVIFGKMSDSLGFEYRLGVISSGGLLFEVFRNGGTIHNVVVASALSTGVWYHALVWFRDDKYILGRAAGPGALSVSNGTYGFTSWPGGTLDTGTGAFRVGAVVGPTNPCYFDGLIGPLRFWRDPAWAYQSVGTANDNLRSVFQFLHNDGAGKTLSELSSVGTATYVGTDTTTQGSWIGVYGADGYYLSGAINGESSPPSYGTLRFFSKANSGYAVANEYTWGQGGDPKGLQKPSDPSGDRYYVTWYGDGSFIEFYIDLGATTRRVSIYFLDYDTSRTGQTAEVRDMATGDLLDGPRSLGTFSAGKWLTWDVSGPVVLRANFQTANAAFAAVMFDTPSAPSTGNPWYYQAQQHAVAG